MANGRDPHQAKRALSFASLFIEGLGEKVEGVCKIEARAEAESCLRASNCLPV